MRLIDATELNGYKFGLISPCVQKLFHDTINNAPTVNAIPIPKGATNGEVIKAMLGNTLRISEDKKGVRISTLKGRMIATFSYEWWNAPYKREN